MSFLILLVLMFQGCAFGYHAGGWGKPPVDENGKPLYGDVFGTQSAEFQVLLCPSQRGAFYGLYLFFFSISFSPRKVSI